ncbi:MAG: hypothetical protein CMJ46_08955 [Planctomyces sp.]|nr:hypothetical protein [Planctomyces sp.]
MSARVEDVVLPRSELQVKEIEESTPIVLRIINVRPHGPDMYRYTFEYYGLKPGDYNLVDYLERKDASAVGELSPVPVAVTSVLPAYRVEPNAPTEASISRLGGYRYWLIGIAMLWTLGFCVILLARKKKSSSEVDGQSVVVPTLAERLRPMVEQAISGQLSHSRMAELEMMLVAFWRRRLHLEQEDVAVVTRKLKQHEEAGPLLRELETLLHRPNSQHEVDMSRLLQPYQNLPADELDENLVTVAT